MLRMPLEDRSTQRAGAKQLDVSQQVFQKKLKELGVTVQIRKK